jgi:acetyl esterase/lipase
MVVVVAAALVAGCATPFVAPPGDAPVRYRDLVFGSVTTTSGVSYGRATDQQGVDVDLRLDLYSPQGDTVTARPAIVWVHGGSFRSGSSTSPEIVDQATTFARKGYVTASINYRLSTGGCSAAAPSAGCITAIVDAQHDAQAAVRFLRSRAAAYGIDPERIAIAGSSAGAITALNVGYNRTDPGASGNPGWSSGVRAAVSLSGAMLLATADAGDAPALLFHGTADTTVPYQWAVNTVDAAKAANLAVYLTTFDGAGHVPYAQHRAEILDQTTNFLFWELDLLHAAA